MLIARFYFKPGCAGQWAWSAGQDVVEIMYDCVFDIICQCQEIEDLLLDCLVFDGQQVISLKLTSEEQGKKEEKAKARRTRSNKKKAD